MNHQAVQEGGASNYNKLTMIEQPEVPPSVLALNSVPEQIEEMRAYFRVRLLPQAASAMI